MYQILASTNFEDWFMEDLEASSEVVASFECFTGAVTQFLHNVKNGYTIEMSTLDNWLVSNYTQDEIGDFLGEFCCCATMSLVKLDAEPILMFSHRRDYNFITKELEYSDKIIVETSMEADFTREEIDVLEQFNLK